MKPSLALWPLALALAASAGCGRGSTDSPASPGGSPAQAVEGVRPVRHTFRLVVEEPGQIEAFERTPIHAHVSGYVAEVCVDMDARVKKGQVLARLAVPELEDELKQKEALVGQARAELEQERKALAAAAANFETARARVVEAEAGRKRALANLAYWQSEHRRMDKLVTRRVIDEQALAEARNKLESSQAEREEIEAKVSAARAARAESAARRDKKAADVETARARLKVAEAAARRAGTLLQYADLRAPFAGVVTVRDVHTGHHLKGGNAAGGKPLFVVVRTDPVRVFIDVPEAEAALVRPGTAATVRVQGLRDKEFEGKVIRTSWTLEPRNRTLRAEVELPNPTGELRPGLYAHAALAVEHAAAWALPASAVVQTDEGIYCNRVVNGKAIRTPLRLGARDGGLVEILKARLPARAARAGLRWLDFSGDELIVASGAATLADGQAVTVRPPRAGPANAPSGAAAQ